ncbi:hypothetical protein [uncultured Roseobacter sp.]|uniref:hypothetical protein n=1 Tax=uncultured Roseobacter sp. TaxID=114847 RepID=UPI002629990C|nr:hypothetical protein [uncultured Roseobacter sp.]
MSKSGVGAVGITLIVAFVLAVVLGASFYLIPIGDNGLSAERSFEDILLETMQREGYFSDPAINESQSQIVTCLQHRLRDDAIVLVNGEPLGFYQECYPEFMTYCFMDDQIIYPAMEDSTVYVYRNGEKIANSEHAFVDTIVCSKEGDSVAFLVDAKDGGIAVNNSGILWDPHHGVGNETLTFSDNGESLAYLASGRSGLYYLVKDNAPWKFRSRSFVRGLLEFSPDSTRVAYGAIVASSDENAEHQIVVVDDEWTSQPYDFIGRDSLTFSPDSKRLAFSAFLGDQVFAVVDGQPWMNFESFVNNSLKFSPDSQRFAYIAIEGDMHRVVVDRRVWRAYDSSGENTLTFSPDSERLAYVALDGGQAFVVADGNEWDRYDSFGSGGLLFSPNSVHLAYFAIERPKNGEEVFFIVKDNVAWEPYESADTSTIRFSEDSESLAYLAIQGPNGFVVEDNSEVVTRARVRFWLDLMNIPGFRNSGNEDA